MESHPLRMRGLKQSYCRCSQIQWRSHPLRMRGLKHVHAAGKRASGLSHPLRMRGLKLFMLRLYNKTQSRILYGCVD